jgi:eukaryotic-like serine/threonine-protein kinase
MVEKRCCPDCNTELSTNAPEGLCPKCLIRMGLAGEAEIDPGTSASIEGPGTVIGRYTLLELIGEGGMGRVYLAEQQEPVKRQVALKIVKLGMDTIQVVARFQAEQQTLALLDHAHIAHIFDAGTTEGGRPYFVMEYVEGMPVTAYCDRHQLSIDERLGLFLQVCSAIQHAHQKGILHRDIKPSNIMVAVGDHGPVLKIIDFGIAKAITQPLGEHQAITEQGQLLGTPEYMSPEQADLAYEQVDTRSDVYSLGVVLYELLAGATPFSGKVLREGGIEQVRAVIRAQDPITPSARLTDLGNDAQEIALRRDTQLLTLTRRLRKELEWIPLKALRKEPDQRYASVSELAKDISNYLAGNALMAGPESGVYRARKFVRKHAGSVTTVALVAVAIVIGLLASMAIGFQAERARRAETVARAAAEKARAQAEQLQSVAQEEGERAEDRAEKYRKLFYVHSVAMADVKYRERNLRSTRTLLESCPEDLQNWEWYRLNYVMDESPVTFRADKGVVSIAISPDGKSIASGFTDITIWDMATRSAVHTLKGHKSAVFVKFSPDGKHLASASMDKTIKIWDVTTGKERTTLTGHEKAVMSIAFSADGKHLVSGSRDQTAKVWDVDNAMELLTIPVGGEEGLQLQSVAISPDGQRILVGGYSNEIHEWDAETGKALRRFSTDTQKILQVSYSPDGKWIALGCGEGMIKLVDTVSGNERILTYGQGWHQSLIQSLAFSPDSQRLVSGGYERLVKVWDTQTGKELTALMGHSARIAGVAFSPTGQRIVSADFSGHIKIWDPQLDRASTILRDAQGNVPYKLAFSPDGRRLASASSDKTVKVWDVDSHAELMSLKGHEDEVYAVAFSPDGRKIVSGSKDKTVIIWDSATGDQLRILRGHEGHIWSVAFSPDSQRIASGSYDGTVRVWDATTGDTLMTLDGKKKNIDAVAYSPDGKWIVSGAGNGTMTMWDASTGEELKTLPGHRGRVRSIVFSADGKRLVSGSFDETVKIWDTASGKELMTLHGHKSSVHAAAISPDNTRIVSGSYIATKLWDAETGAELMTLPTDESVLCVAFSPDGKRIAGSHLAGYISLWDSGPRGGDNSSN